MLEACERIPYSPPERRLEQRALVRWFEQQLSRYAIGVYNEAGIIVEFQKCFVQWAQPIGSVAGCITYAEVNALCLRGYVATNKAIEQKKLKKL